MNKKSTTKISTLLFSIFFCLVLFSCTGLNNNSNFDTTPSKTELYKSMIGKWIYYGTDREYHISLSTVYFTDKYIKYVNPENETKVDTRWFYENALTFKELKEKINENEIQLQDIFYYTFSHQYSEFNDSDLCFYKVSSTDFYRLEINIYKIIDNKLYEVYYAEDQYGSVDVSNFYKVIYNLETLSPETNPEDNSETPITDSDLTGSYTISEANGSTFTFASDGNWTYKYNSRTTNGTWSVSEGKVTINYSLGGYSSTAVFTVKVSDNNKYTLTGKSGDYTTIISSAFMITNQEAMEKGVVTLVKQ